MLENKLHGDAYVNSIVGEGTHFKGDLELNGLLRLDGDFTGSIKTEGKVIIGKNGRADCAIDAHIVVIGGVFRGNIYAREKVILLSSSMIVGNIYSPSIIAEEGVLLNGTFVVSGKTPHTEHRHVEPMNISKKRGNFLQFIKNPLPNPEYTTPPPGDNEERSPENNPRREEVSGE
jgi:cytoskeletal protein CcmA (bactofilin family)